MPVGPFIFFIYFLGSNPQEAALEDAVAGGLEMRVTVQHGPVRSALLWLDGWKTHVFTRELTLSCARRLQCQAVERLALRKRCRICRCF